MQVYSTSALASHFGLVLDGLITVSSSSERRNMKIKTHGHGSVALILHSLSCGEAKTSRTVN